MLISIWVPILSLLVILVICLASSPQRDFDSDYNEVQASIQNLRSQLQRSGLSSKDAGELWLQLGAMLMLKDVRYHEDGITVRDEALHALEAAIAAVPSGSQGLKISAYHKRGMLLKMMGRGAEAVESHSSALELASSDVDRAVCLQFKASAVSMMGDANASVALYRESLRLAPSQLGIYLPLAECLKEVGQTPEQWRALLQEALEAGEDFDSGDIEAEASQALRFEYDVGTRSAQYHWALYIIADKAKEYSAAWKSLEKAHEIQIRNVGLPVPTVFENKDRNIKTFQKGFWDPVVGYPTRTPVFVIGSMRSGSTLMETMLDAHPQVWGLGEDSVFNSRLPAFQKDFVAEVSKGDINAANSVIAKFGSEILETMKLGLQRDGSVSTHKKKGVRRIVDKMLFNYNNLGMLHMIFPNAPVVHMIRDPLDTLFSCYKHKFDEAGLRWSLDFDMLVDQYVAYLEILAHFRKVLPGRVYDVRYEELVRDPEGVMRGVVKHLGLVWDASILDFHMTNRSVQTFSSSQVRQKLYTDSIGGWRKYAKQLGPLIKRFRKHIPRLRKAGVLPYAEEVNWGMDVDFPYPSDAAKASKLVNVEVDTAGNVIASEGAPVSRKMAKKNRKESGEKPSKRRKRSKMNAGDKSKRRRTKSRGFDANAKAHVSGRGHNKPRRTSETAVRSKDATMLESLKPICYNNMRMGDTQALNIANSFDYKMEDVEAAKLVSCAYMLLQVRNFDVAYELLTGLIAYDDDMYQAHVALIGFYQINGRYQEALKVVTKLLAKLPNSNRAIHARADVMSSMGHYDQALLDWTTVLEYEKTFAAYFGRGLAQYHKKNYRKAYSDFRKATAYGVEARGYNAIGKCLKEVGEDLKAAEMQKKALEIDGNYKEAALDAAIAYMSQSMAKEAEEYLDKALALDPDFVIAHGWAALYYDQLGESRQVLASAQRTLELDPTQHTTMNLAALTHFALGEFQAAAKYFDTMLSMNPNDSAWFKREILFYYWSTIDRSVQTFNINKDVHPRVKEGFATSAPNHEEFMRDYPEYESVAETYSHLLTGKEARPTLPEKGLELLRLTSTIAGWIQVDSPGFMPHKRHYRMFGLAVLHAAQTLRRHVALLKSSGSGLEVPDSSSSHSDDISVKVVKEDHHSFGWRDFFDIIIRWRQLSAPGDPIWWTDQLTQKQYHERQGMTTWMLNGEGVNVRYGPYAPFALNVTREMLLAQGFLPQVGTSESITDPVLRALAENATHISDLYKAVGGRPFYVTAPCRSSTVPGRVLAGTMLRVDKSHPDGWDFGICTQTSFDRYTQYEEEMEGAFQRVVRVLLDPELDEVGRSEAMTRHTLELFFYWINFTPITRGTSATGYAAILAGVLATGEKIDTPVPKGKQLDWEGILTADPKEFIDRIYPWIAARSRSEIPEKWLNGEPGYRLEEIFDTTRKMMAAINGE